MSFIKYLPKRHFPRTPMGANERIFGDTTREKPSPYYLKPELREKILKFQNNRLKDYDTIQSCIHDFEVFL